VEWFEILGSFTSFVKNTSNGKKESVLSLFYCQIQRPPHFITQFFNLKSCGTIF